jgi:hypothetical protein
MYNYSIDKSFEQAEIWGILWRAGFIELRAAG